MFWRKNKQLEELEARFQQQQAVLSAVCSELQNLTMAVKGIRDSNLETAARMSDKLIEMAMVNSGMPREAVAIRAQERLDSFPLREEPRGGNWEDEGDEWPPRGTVEHQVP